jgi:N-acetylmuramoyl-L-alanine amidase
VLEGASLLALCSALLLIFSTGIFGVQGGPNRVASAPGAVVTFTPRVPPASATTSPTPAAGMVLGTPTSTPTRTIDIPPTQTAPATVSARPTTVVPSNTPTPGPTRTADRGGATIAIIAGHRNNDSGAICENGPYEGLYEVHVTTAVTEQLAERLRAQGHTVIDLDELDSRLYGLEATLLLSIHVDSCVDWEGTTGYKLARSEQSAIPEIEDRLVSCVDVEYGRATGLPHHSHSITHHMTDYHAFRKVHLNTPAAIIELGFLYHDHELLTEGQEMIVDGLFEGIICFLEGADGG